MHPLLGRRSRAPHQAVLATSCTQLPAPARPDTPPALAPAPLRPSTALAALVNASPAPTANARSAAAADSAAPVPVLHCPPLPFDRPPLVEMAGEVSRTRGHRACTLTGRTLGTTICR